MKWKIRRVHAGVLILAMLLVLVVAALSLMGPAVDNMYSNLNSPLVSDGSRAIAVGYMAGAQEEYRAVTNDDAFGPLPQQDRVILRNASLSITVEDPEMTIREIAALADSMNGWVVESNTFTTTRADGEDATSGFVTIRIPAERLNQVLNRIKADTVSVDNEAIAGQDVTNEYVDLSSRLRNLEASETQLQTIMDRAQTVEDVLAVQRELTTVRSEIESIQGRLNFFNESAAFALVRVDVRPQALGPVASQQLGWNPGTTVENALGALVSVLKFLADAAIVLVIIGLPLVLLIGLPLWILWRSRKRRALRVAESSE